MNVDSDHESEDRQFKIQLSNKFYEDRRQIRIFITQLRVYFKLAEKIHDISERKIFLIISLLRKTALNWIQSMIENYLNNSTKKRKEMTNKIFFDEQTLINELHKRFENQEKIRTAKRKLWDLRHTESIFTYNMLFQQYFLITEWDESTLVATYYEELHHEIKNVLIIKSRSKDLEELQKSAIEIAENMYELRTRKRAYIYKRKKRNYQNRNVDFMKIDILKRAKNISCFKCEKKNHKKRDCKEIQTLETLNELLNTTETSSKDLTEKSNR